MDSVVRDENLKEEYEESLRPLKIKDYIGQNDVKNNIDVFIKAALLKRREIVQQFYLHLNLEMYYLLMKFIDFHLL